MTDHKHDGGPAFPFVKWRTPDGMVGIQQDAGMSLRDWFAGQAREADIEYYREACADDAGSSRGVVALGLPRLAPPLKYRYTRVEARYRYADAMLAERAKK